MIGGIPVVSGLKLNNNVRAGLLVTALIFCVKRYKTPQNYKFAAKNSRKGF